jgi:TPR repeat protein
MPHPVTHDELNRLRNTWRANPADNATGLLLAKKLVEAANVLADEGGTADSRTRNKNREKFILEGHKIIKKLSSAGYAEATFYLADCYGQGLLGLQVDTKEAFLLYQSGAKAGHAASAYRTAVCCEMGHEEGGGTKKDPLKAVQWYRRAAALGDTPALYKMGMILLKGLLGQQKNFGEAINMLKRAADRADKDNPHALHELALIYEAQTGNERIIQDEAYALQLFHQAADLNYKFSQFRLGQAYEYGLLGCPIDARTSIAWYTRAAAQEEHQSELALSGWYLTGTQGILEQSDTEAYLWARKAACAEPPLPKALFAMGYFTEVGIGCPRSLDEAKRWYGRAAGKLIIAK